MNFATIVVLIIIGAALCAAVFSMVRSRRRGGCGGCAGCGNRGCCSRCPGDFQEEGQAAKKQ